MARGFDVVTIFPGMVRAYLGESIIKRAIQGGLLDVSVHNLRDFTNDRHRTTDDYPYGGGSGMVMKVEPLYEALSALRQDGAPRVTVLLTPQGKTYTQQTAERLAADERRIVLVCGRYEGIDERARELLVDEELSIGDYVLTGGELASLVIIDSVARLLPGVLGDADSAREESFTWGILDYPHYTRPPEFMSHTVPDVLLSGNHRDIAQWRRREALRRTLERRPDLLEKADLTIEDKRLLRELCSDRTKSSGEDTDESYKGY
ncbi:MAG TPA: tRNA (guanosine(37)-N1)-methyltransferase TrmD [Dissulfurispiraceae bacterium]|nr:tRNA (guanosine(37)-N1)-methyltransferase TrmD [Dissulfurispiraceae bacterium]